ncbi:uncharacterized protein BDZ99DRAFT_518074 [Mytilinidion resinicola]|uniref:Uncharacterized protein n=1 Tax=Mytilinidion resinicola TaxID=574789 RepID=A0A6A6YUM1_9PEZI|nr:uncharacterized protein BDZ99DRAFT_518074 [Mytilinidion resinicola]KAF2812219.1 hypothetical protein BDZ99DRAFT_518074 [Mytilinidion resinicola]
MEAVATEDVPNPSGRVLRKRKRTILSHVDGEGGENLNNDHKDNHYQNAGINPSDDEVYNEDDGQERSGVKVKASRKKVQPRKKAKTSVQAIQPAADSTEPNSSSGVNTDQQINRHSHPALAQPSATGNAQGTATPNVQQDIKVDDTADDDKKWEIITPDEGRYKLDQERSMTLQRRHKISGLVKSATYGCAYDGEENNGNAGTNSVKEEMGDMAPANDARTAPFIIARREGDRVKLRITGLRSLVNSNQVEQGNGEGSSVSPRPQPTTANSRAELVAGKKRRNIDPDDSYVSVGRRSKRAKTGPVEQDDDEVMEIGQMRHIQVVMTSTRTSCKKT